MPDEVLIRPLRVPEDVPAAADAGAQALNAQYPQLAGDGQDVERRRRTERRVAHLGTTDPGGCWVADAAGEVVGVSLSLVREGVWGCSLLGVRPEHHRRGLGSRLFAPALAYGADQPGGIILSSDHPAAMRTYARAGFALHPCVELSGAWDPRRVPAGLRSRPGDLERDAETLHRASRHARGASHEPDWATLLDRCPDLLVLEGRGFAFAKDGSVSLLAATDEEAARDLLWSALVAGPRGGTVSYDFVTAQNGWAVDVGLEAGLALSAGGPLFTRGRLGTMAPFLPSGAFL